MTPLRTIPLKDIPQYPMIIKIMNAPDWAKLSKLLKDATEDFPNSDWWPLVAQRLIELENGENDE